MTGAFGTCLCGHPIYDHGRRTLPSSGGLQEYTGCRLQGCLCDKFRASDGSAWPTGPARPIEPEPSIEYALEARKAAGEQTRSPRLADNSPAAPPLPTNRRDAWERMIADGASEAEATATYGDPDWREPEPELRARARAIDPPTSHAAARSIKAQELRQSQEAVLEVFRLNGAMDDVELVERYIAHARDRRVKAQSPSGIRTRRHELVDAGQIRDTGRTVRLESGRHAIVWERVEPLALTIDSAYDPEPEL